MVKYTTTQKTYTDTNVLCLVKLTLLSMLLGSQVVFSLDVEKWPL